MAAKIGLGITLEYETAVANTFIAVGELIEVSEPQASTDSVDTSDHSHTDAIRRFIPALIDNGEFEFTINYDPIVTQWAQLETLRTSRVIRRWRITHPGGVGGIRTFQAFITELGPETPREEKMTATFTLKVTGAITIS